MFQAKTLFHISADFMKGQISLEYLVLFLLFLSLLSLSLLSLNSILDGASISFSSSKFASFSKNLEKNMASVCSFGDGNSVSIDADSDFSLSSVFDSSSNVYVIRISSSNFSHAFESYCEIENKNLKNGNYILKNENGKIIIES
jgi:uncharacterized protein (UPF0333 family)